MVDLDADLDGGNMTLGYCRLRHWLVLLYFAMILPLVASVAHADEPAVHNLDRAEDQAMGFAGLFTTEDQFTRGAVELVTLHIKEEPPVGLPYLAAILFPAVLVVFLSIVVTRTTQALHFFE